MKDASVKTFSFSYISVYMCAYMCIICNGKYFKAALFYSVVSHSLA